MSTTCIFSEFVEEKNRTCRPIFQQAGETENLSLSLFLSLSLSISLSLSPFFVHVIYKLKLVNFYFILAVLHVQKSCVHVVMEYENGFWTCWLGFLVEFYSMPCTRYPNPGHWNSVGSGILTNLFCIRNPITSCF